MGLAAYGYVLIQSFDGSAAQTGRYEGLCAAFNHGILVPSNTIPAATPPDQITTTYWPVQSRLPGSAPCATLVKNYDLTRAQLLRRLTNLHSAARGPFLVALSGRQGDPKRGAPRALILDLSHVQEEKFDEALELWQEHITSDPAIWNRGLGALEKTAGLVSFLNTYGCTALKTVGFDELSKTACG